MNLWATILYIIFIIAEKMLIFGRVDQEETGDSIGHDAGESIPYNNINKIMLIFYIYYNSI